MTTIIPRLLSLIFLLMIAWQSFGAGFYVSPVVKKSGSITYIDIGIYQPNVEECFGTYVPELEGKTDWIKIFPNPNPGKFTLELNLLHPATNLVIQMNDLSGKLVYENRITASGSFFRKALDVSNLPKGMYFIRITDKDKVGVKQIIIN